MRAGIHPSNSVRLFTLLSRTHADVNRVAFGTRSQIEPRFRVFARNLTTISVDVPDLAGTSRLFTMNTPMSNVGNEIKPHYHFRGCTVDVPDLVYYVLCYKRQKIMIHPSQAGKRELIAKQKISESQRLRKLSNIPKTTEAGFCAPEAGTDEPCK